jgi:hypothetical protein
VYMDGGYAACVVYEKQRTNAGAATDKPRNSKIKARVQNNRYGVLYMYAGYGHELELECDTVQRALFLNGVQGLRGTIKSQAGISDDILIGPDNGATLEDIDITFHRKASTQPAISFQCQDSTAYTAKKLRFRGHVQSTNQAAIRMDLAYGHTGTVIEDIDFSDLMLTTSASTGGRGIYIKPDVACTIKKIRLPKRINSLGTNAEIDNTNSATISDITIPEGSYWEFQASSAGEGPRFFGGTISRVEIGDGCTFDATNTSATNVVNLATCAGLTIGKIRVTNSKNVRTIGSTSVAPANFDHAGYGFVRRGATLADTSELGGQETLIFTSGTTTYNSFKHVIPGQRVTFIANGGTPTFTDGANLVMTGGVNMTMAAGDTITFVCGDDPAVGPVNPSTLYEIARSVA